MSDTNQGNNSAVPSGKPELTDEEKAAVEATIEGAPEVSDIDKDSQGLP